MARQLGHIFITGTIHDVTYYKMDGTYYARMKSSLSRKKVLTSPSFALTRMHANQLAEASKIASQLYRSIPKEKRNMPLFRSIVGKSKILLAEGKDKEVVIEILMNELFPKAGAIKQIQFRKRKPTERAFNTKKGKLRWYSIHPIKKDLNIESEKYRLFGTVSSFKQKFRPAPM